MEESTNSVTPQSEESCSSVVLDSVIESIREVGETLIGTCKSADEVIKDVFDDEGLDLTKLPMAALNELDSITMECTVCNWWFEPDELDEDQVCEDCS